MTKPDIFEASGYDTDPGLPTMPAMHPGVVPIAARWLASHGVLLPSALTDDELLACEVDEESSESPVERAEVAVPMSHISPSLSHPTPIVERYQSVA
jgi:hypothetical protein